MINITDTRIHLVKKEGVKVKAAVSLTVDDCLVIHDFKVIESNDGNLYVSMPARRTPDNEYRDIVHPTSNTTRDKLSSHILAEYNKALEAQSS